MTLGFSAKDAHIVFGETISFIKYLEYIKIVF